ncbi:hypothetical protein SUGI_0888770 [Cryptomeria japonica]|nr:hypothetical protein SUGI_0888770 [Cryptomeria japonica]
MKLAVERSVFLEVDVGNGPKKTNGWLQKYLKEGLIGFAKEDSEFGVTVVEENVESNIAMEDMDNEMALKDHINCGPKSVYKAQLMSGKHWHHNL